MLKLIRHSIQPVVLLTVLLSLNVNFSGCASFGDGPLARSVDQRQIDKNGPPYTKYPHLGRNHYRAPHSTTRGAR